MYNVELKLKIALTLN